MKRLWIIMTWAVSLGGRQAGRMISRYWHPFLFYGLSIAIPWAFWFGDCVCKSHHPDKQLSRRSRWHSGSR